MIVVRASFRGGNGKYNTTLCRFLVADASRTILEEKNLQLVCSIQIPVIRGGMSLSPQSISGVDQPWQIFLEPQMFVPPRWNDMPAAT